MLPLYIILYIPFRILIHSDRGGTETTINPNPSPLRKNEKETQAKTGREPPAATNAQDRPTCTGSVVARSDPARRAAAREHVGVQAGDQVGVAVSNFPSGGVGFTPNYSFKVMQ
ncbi:hypothetical protein SUGI_1110060 [Cryptomeria japonica]|nr:hypothetical protein SUGI_1110060 [Cryptomeria japonica]